MSDGDPEDWPAHPVELRQLERSLRCQICQDLYQGPVSLRCGHTFCSICIRNTLSVFSKEGRQQACPTCREAADVTDLRPISHLRDAAAAWRAVRQLLLQQHLQAVGQQQQQSLEPLVQQQQPAAHIQQQQQASRQQQNGPPADSGNGGSLQQRQQPRRTSRTPPSGTVSRQLSGRSRQASGSNGGQQKTPEPAITISSNGADASQSGAADASDRSEDEVASQQQDSDPDWSAEDADRHQQQPTETKHSSKRRLRNCSTSSDRDWSAEAANAAIDADGFESDALADGDESDFEPAVQPAAKRARSAAQQPGPGKENRGGPAQQQPEQPVHAGSSAAQQQPQQPGYVACPICSSSVKETFINSHIDSCLAPMSTGEQQQRSAGRTSTTAVGRPAPTAAVAKSRGSISAPAAVGSVANSSSMHAGSGGSKLGSGRAALPAGAAAAGVSRARVKALEPPPKLCFDLMKDKELKGKLTQLGLSNEGSKQVCSQRYTSFRNFVLSLKDNGTNMTQKEAAAEFTRQERKNARAASRPQSVAALANAGGPTAAGAAAAGQRCGSRGPDDRGVGLDLGAVDNSYATLIQQTRELMAQKKQQAEQQQEQERLLEQRQQPELLKGEASELAAQPSQQQQAGPEHQLKEPAKAQQQQQQQQETCCGAEADTLTDDLQPHDRDTTFWEMPAADTGALKQQQLAVVAAALDACTAVAYVAGESDGYQGMVVPDSDDGT